MSDDDWDFLGDILEELADLDWRAALLILALLAVIGLIIYLT